MNRRGFLGLLGGAVAGAALEKVVPFGRVWSFPSKLVVFRPEVVRPSLAQSIALQLEKVRQHIPVLYENESVLFKLMNDDQVAAWDNVGITIGSGGNHEMAI